MALTIPPGVHRVFIGIPIDENSQQQINKLLKPMKNSSQDVRWVPASHRHLTLAFLGNKPASVVANLIRLFAQTYQQQAHFQYNMSTLTRFPDPEGRIIALVDDPVRPLRNLFRLTLALLQATTSNLTERNFDHTSRWRESSGQNV